MFEKVSSTVFSIDVRSRGGLCKIRIEDAVSGDPLRVLGHIEGTTLQQKLISICFWIRKVDPYELRGIKRYTLYSVFLGHREDFTVLTK